MPEAQKKQKAEIRSMVKQRLAAMTERDHHVASVNACSRLTHLEVFKHANVIMLYMPLRSEVDLTPLALRCFQVGKVVCVPKVDSARMEMTPVEVTTFDSHVMETDEHGVRVPREGRPVSPGLVDVVVVPGLAFDAHGHRLGRGGGYYDRFLARLRPSVVKLALAFDTQIIDHVPTSVTDIPMDIVVTDRRVTHVQSSRLGH